MDLPLFFTLPLIGGFAFVTGFLWLRWRSARQDAQRLYYRAASWGGVLLLAAGAIHAMLMWWPRYANFFQYIRNGFLQPLLTTREAPAPPILLVRTQVAAACIYALLLGIGIAALSRLLWWMTGRKFMRGRWLARFLVKRNLASITDPLERLLSRALLEGEAVQVTLSTAKVYVGYVLEALDPDLPVKFIKLQPLMSGQRDSEGQVKYTTFYDQLLAQFEENPDPAVRAAVASFQLVVPVDKVATLSGFNLDAYIHFLDEDVVG